MLQANSVAIITAAVDRRRLGRAIGARGVDEGDRVESPQAVVTESIGM